MTDRSREELLERARTRDILEVAQRLGAELKRQGAEQVGPCPACGGTDRFSINTRKLVFNCRGADGGDVIRLVMHVKGCDFTAAVAWLTGDDPAPAPKPKPKPARSDAELEADYRAKEIEKARGIWTAGVPIAGTAAEAYLAARGIDVLPPRCELRFAPELPYWHTPKGLKDPQVIHRGPALLGILTNPAGELTGVHITWIDERNPGGKAQLTDPVSGDALPAKKLRGSKRRAAEKLQSPKGGGKRLVIGEGRETVLSVWIAERSKMKASWTHYWSAIDLGHLGGKAKRMVPHPHKRRPDGKALMIPGPEPELQPDRDLMPPDEITQIEIAGDGDSDRITTEYALLRAIARWDRQGRQIGIRWPDGAVDFNDMLREDRP